MAVTKATNRGRYIPRNPGKYVGNPSRIIFRSSWEVTVMRFFDLSTSVLRWGSEEFSISYIHPADRRVHRYFPDFFCVFKNAEGIEECWIVEVKPLKETLLEYAKSDYDKQQLIINQAKWSAAKAFAESRGLKFRVITEKDIFKYRTPAKNKQSRGVRPNKSTIKPRPTVKTKSNRQPGQSRKSK